jgi:putative transcriptional regulator
MIQNLIPTSDPKWKFLSPSLRAAAIPVGENSCELALHKIKAGGSTPSHDHNGREVIVVLKGSFSDEDGIYSEGDFIVRHPGEVHRPQASRNQECICLSVLEAPLKLTGAFHRFLNPFFSFNPQ